MLSVRGSLVESSLLTPKALLLSVCHHQKGGVCKYKITGTKMFLIHVKLNKHTSNKAQAEELKEKQALVIWNRAGRPTMHIGRPNTSNKKNAEKQQVGRPTVNLGRPKMEKNSHTYAMSTHTST